MVGEQDRKKIHLVLELERDERLGAAFLDFTSDLLREGGGLHSCFGCCCLELVEHCQVKSGQDRLFSAVDSDRTD